MDYETGVRLNWVALIVAPLVAGWIASVFARASARLGSVWLRGFLGTLAIGVMLGAASGLVIDLLHPGFMPPATVMLGALEVPISAGVGLVVGWACARSVGQHRVPQDKA